MEKDNHIINQYSNDFFNESSEKSSEQESNSSSYYSKLTTLKEIKKLNIRKGNYNKGVLIDKNVNDKSNIKLGNNNSILFSEGMFFLYTFFIKLNFLSFTNFYFK